jgi:TonB-linked SusC/RagA family outer membrane protein
MKANLILCLILLSCTFLIGQNTVIRGTVTTTDGPLPGVNILEEGTKNGTVTDIEGTFLLNVDSSNAFLLISFVGYQTKRIAYEGQTSLDIFLEMDQTDLGEVVVIGYGTATRREITSSIASVEGEDLNRMTVGNVSESLQGLASGVQVVNGGGGPGQSPQILVRGIVTNQNTEPLIVVDGVPLPEGSNLNFLNPSDIESMQILKDGSAASIYGTRASNGVVLITTVRGVNEKPVITFTSSYGAKALAKPAVANAREYAQVMNARQTNDGQAPIYSLDAIDTDTDWWNEVYKDYAAVQNYNVQVRGGSQKVKYLSSVAYFRENSHLDKGYWQRITGRFNIDYQVTDRLKIQQDFNPRYENWETTPDQFRNTLAIDPLTPVFLNFDERAGRNEFSIYGRSQNFVWNPVAAVARNFDNSYFFSFFSNTNISFDITEHLTVSSRLGLSLGQTRNDIFNPQFVVETNLEDNPQSRVQSRFTNTFDYVWNNLLNYNRGFGRHNLDLTAGLVYERNQSNYLYGSRTDILLNDDNFRFLDATTGDGILAFGNENANSLMSYLVRAKYSFADRYYLAGSFRRDGSSRFPVDNRWANFYSLSGAWNIANETFFNVRGVDVFKLKAGFGQVGNQNIPASAFLFLVGNESFVLGENRDRVVTNFISQFGNPSLQWETVEDINVGIEASFFDYKLSFAVDRYIKESRGLLFPTSLPLFTGSPSTIIQNVGSFRSEGWDFSLAYNTTVRDWRIGANLTLNTNESRAIELPPGNEQIFAQRREEFGNNFLKLTELNQVVGLFYGFETAGIFQNRTEINSHSTDKGVLIQPNAQPGDLIFVDQNNDGVLDEADMVAIGNPFPDFNAGLLLNLGYKKWDLSMQWYGVYGNDVYNYNKSFLTSGNSNLNVQAGLLNDAWSEANPDGVIPRLTNNDPNNNFRRSSDYFVEDGSFLRLKNIQLGYNFDVKFASQLRVYVSGQNLLTFTNYTGFDPEVSASGGIINGLGVDFGRYPLARTFLTGVNMTF